MVCYQRPISCGVPARATYKLSTYRLRPFDLTFEKVGGGMTTRAHVRADILHAENSWTLPTAILRRLSFCCHLRSFTGDINVKSISACAFVIMNYSCYRKSR